MDNLIWHTEKRKYKDLIPFVHNPRKMTEDQVKALTDSIDRFGMVEIPAINTHNTLLTGHQRVRIEMMRGHGEEEIDVRVPNRPLTEEEFKEYNVRSNQNHGSWDYDLLSTLFDENELLSIGFSEKDLSIADIDEIEEKKGGKEVECPKCGETFIL